MERICQPRPEQSLEDESRELRSKSSLWPHLSDSAAFLERSRDRNRELGMQKLREGDSNAAAQYFVKAVDVTPQMAWTLIQVRADLSTSSRGSFRISDIPNSSSQELKKLNVQYVVAPYEADAQLAFLCREGIVDAVISEDSDCLPYGCQRVRRFCSPLLVPLQAVTGEVRFC